MLDSRGTGQDFKRAQDPFKASSPEDPTSPNHPPQNAHSETHQLEEGDVPF